MKSNKLSYISYLAILIIPSIGNAIKLEYNDKNGEIFQKITNIFQAYLTFIEGPFATMAIFASIIIGVCAWVYSPKNGAMGFLVRLCIGGILTLNIGSVFKMFKNIV